MKGFEITLEDRYRESPSEVTIVVRADRDLTYRVLNNVMETCKSVGFSQFVFVVMRQAKEQGPQ